MGRVGTDADSLQLGSARVLVVDDMVLMLDVVAAMLERHGATVLTADTAEKALTLLQEWRPDAMVSDIDMPGKDGYWLIAQVRALPAERGGETPAAALTARTGPEDRARILRAGFQYHLPKPFDPTALVGVIGILALKP
jgi:CheY-like chemotaxis protein